MQTRKLGKHGPEVSTIALGTAMFGFPGIGCTEEAAQDIFGAYRAGGGNFIDTADFYGAGICEEITGRLLRGCRREFVLATKVGQAVGSPANGCGLSRAYVMRALDDSLRRLQTDYIDLYQLHSVDPRTPIEETLETLHDLVRSGRVRAIGCCNIEAWRLAGAVASCQQHDWTPFSCAQFRYSLLSREIEREHVPLCEAQNLGIIVFNPLAAGALTGKVGREGPPADSRLGKARQRYQAYLSPASLSIVERVIEVAQRIGATPAQTALAWAIGRPGITSVINGASRGSQMRENIAAADLTLPAGERALLDQISLEPLGYPYDFMLEIEASAMRPVGDETWPWSDAWRGHAPE
jgi:aryl-alcohol dehydrogenase-like predicted oxidoreductase